MNTLARGNSLPDLSGLRVIEVGTAVAVPLVGAILASLGAEVIKLESASKLDGNRARLPASGEGGFDENFPLLQEMNAGKKSVLLNLKAPKGIEIFTGLLASADVFIQNFAPGWLDRLGLPADKILKINPRLIMCFGSGYGQSGPKKDQRVYAPVMTALGGLEGLVGSEDGEVCGMLAGAWADYNAVHLSTSWIFAALHNRRKTGRGGLIDFGQVEAVVSTLGEALVETQLAGTSPGPRGNKSFGYAPRNAFPTKGEDQWATITVTDDDAWVRLVDVIRADDAALAESLGRAEWRQTANRIRDRAEIEEQIAGWTYRFEAKELARRLQSVRVASAPLLMVEDLVADAHLAARGFTSHRTNAVGTGFDITNPPWLFNGKPLETTGAGPLFGADTTTVLTRLLNMSEAEITQYMQEGVLA